MPAEAGIHLLGRFALRYGLEMAPGFRWGDGPKVNADWKQPNPCG